MEPKDDERAHDVLELDLEHLVTLVLGDLLVFPARERMGARAGDPQSLRLEELGQGVSHLAELVARLVDVLADGGADLDHGLHHLPLDLVAQLRCSRRQQGVDMRVELARGVDDLVFLFDTDRQKAVPTHAGPSTTNVGTTLPAPASSTGCVAGWRPAGPVCRGVRTGRQTAGRGSSSCAAASRGSC